MVFSISSRRFTDRLPAQRHGLVRAQVITSQGHDDDLAVDALDEAIGGGVLRTVGMFLGCGSLCEANVVLAQGLSRATGDVVSLYADHWSSPTEHWKRVNRIPRR